MTHLAPVILDIAGTRLTPVDRRRLAHPLTGGIILFARNWENRAQLGALCADIKRVRSDLLICVDHEGGRVQRFRSDGFTHLPPMRALGERWFHDDRNAPGSGAMGACNSASAAGYANPYKCANQIAKSESVQEALRQARDELSSAAQISRADVLDGFMEAINLARLSADPQAMIKGWTEVGKMLGYYAPEVKKLEISDNQKRLQSKFESMSDEDLMRVIEGEASVVDE